MEIGISTLNLNAIHTRLDGQSVTPSFHAFCHLTPVPVHATEQLLAMSKLELLRLDNRCHNALSMCTLWPLTLRSASTDGIGLSRRTRAEAVDEPERPSLAVPSISRVTPRSRANTTEVSYCAVIDISDLQPLPRPLSETGPPP